jgi:glycine/D-amino acid oxidase-like deaminating enzyme
MSQAYDAIVAGGGLSGILAVARLALMNPQGRYLLLEKEPVLGGRLRTTNPEQRIFGYGLNALSERLFDYLSRTLKADPEGPDLSTLVGKRQTRMGVLAGQKIAETEIAGWFTPQGARVLGGLSAAKGWAEVETICRQGAVRGTSADDDVESEDSDDAVVGDAPKPRSKGAEAKSQDQKQQSFAHLWKSTRKVPAAVVLEHFANALGIPDVWGSSATALAERAAYHSGRLYCGPFDAAFDALLACEWFHQAVSVITSSRIVSAKREDDLWEIQAEGITYHGRMLVVAQPPWQATAWLPKALWPAHVLQVANKTKPVSVVVLTEKVLASDVPLPDVTMIPSEHVQMIRNSPDEVCFQATIDYELSLQAPAVVKAVKALKRARKKLLQLHPGLVSETGHIALQPIAWAQSPSQSDRKWLERLSKKPPIAKSLAFVGDAYGESYDGDTNILTSLSHLLGSTQDA